MDVINVVDKDFQQKIIEASKEGPIVVDFWATWCTPCLMLSPTLEKLANEYKGRLVLAKVNVDIAPSVSRQYGIMSIPSVMLFKNGEVVDQFVGALPEERVRSWLEKNI